MKLSNSPDENRTRLCEIIRQSIECVHASKLTFFLTLLSHQLALAGRGSFDQEPTPKLLALNELQFRVTGYLQDIQLGQDYLTPEDLANTLTALALEGKCLFELAQALYLIFGFEFWTDKQCLPQLLEFMDSLENASN